MRPRWGHREVSGSRWRGAGMDQLAVRASQALLVAFSTVLSGRCDSASNYGCAICAAENLESPGSALTDLRCSMKRNFCRGLADRVAQRRDVASLADVGRRLFQAFSLTISEAPDDPADEGASRIEPFTTVTDHIHTRAGARAEDASPCREALLRPGHRVLDIGSGWGGMGFYSRRCRRDRSHSVDRAARVVCTENPIRLDAAMESPKLAE